MSLDVRWTFTGRIIVAGLQTLSLGSLPGLALTSGILFALLNEATDVLLEVVDMEYALTLVKPLGLLQSVNEFDWVSFPIHNFCQVFREHIF